ncbi:MAG TPA: coenzyme F420-0:L-glutamate ligase [Ktedonobacterales bacterium]|jgi:coenzyme F420-0:L-glutamate ligase/coenzyme F420-1:gamma-L-glutamate ligase
MVATPDHSGPPAPSVTIIGLTGVPEILPDADLAGLVLASAEHSGLRLADGDVVVVTHKAVAKAEGRLLDLRTVEPSPLASQYAAAWNRDPRQVEVVLRESARIVRMDRGLIISRTRHGFVCANAGVDHSNVPGGELVCLLPLDPDASAAALRATLRARADVEVAVVVSDSFGRPWREGIVNVAIGAAGLATLIDYRGQPDNDGRVMSATIMAVADELAAASELVTGKLDRCPFAVIRGYPYRRAEGSAREMIMDPAQDLFR